MVWSLFKCTTFIYHNKPVEDNHHAGTMSLLDTWWFPKKNTPKSSMLMEVYLIKHPLWSTPTLANPHMEQWHGNLLDKCGCHKGGASLSYVRLGSLGFVQNLNIYIYSYMHIYIYLYLC